MKSIQFNHSFSSLVLFTFKQIQIKFTMPYMPNILRRTFPGLGKPQMEYITLNGKNNGKKTQKPIA